MRTIRKVYPWLLVLIVILMDIAAWMTYHDVNLHPDKTALLWITVACTVIGLGAAGIAYELFKEKAKN